MTYSDPEAAAVDLLEDEETNEVHYGMVRAEWKGDDEMTFYNTDTGHSYAQIRWSKDRTKERYEDIVRLLVKSDEEIRNNL